MLRRRPSRDRWVGGPRAVGPPDLGNTVLVSLVSEVGSPDVGRLAAPGHARCLDRLPVARREGIVNGNPVCTRAWQNPSVEHILWRHRDDHPSSSSTRSSDRARLRRPDRRRYCSAVSTRAPPDPGGRDRPCADPYSRAEVPAIPRSGLRDDSADQAARVVEQRSCTDSRRGFRRAQRRDGVQMRVAVATRLDAHRDIQHRVTS